MLLQILVLNHINLGGFINPYIYVLFLLILPFEIPGWALLLVSFGTGFTIDWFSHTAGMHTFTCTLVGYLRIHILKMFAPRDGYESGIQPNARFMGFNWFIRYATVIVVVHHFVLFFVESFTFHLFFATLLRIILSSIATLVIIALSQLLIMKR
jgi:rod shape-determining protein MreD